jgi:hypothetical protein
MTKIEMVAQAMRALGDVSAEGIVAFVEREHRETIDPRFIPIYVASIRDSMRLDAARHERVVAPKVEAEHSM